MVIDGGGLNCLPWGDPWETRPETTRTSRSTCEHLAHNTLVICCVRTCLWAMRQPSYFVSLLGYSLHCALGQLGHATVCAVCIAHGPLWHRRPHGHHNQPLPCVTGRCVVASPRFGHHVWFVMDVCHVFGLIIRAARGTESCSCSWTDRESDSSYSCMLISRMPTRQYCSDRYAL